MTKKCDAPRCDESMARGWQKSTNDDFHCNHIGSIKENDCWRCGCLIARVGLEDEHLNFKPTYNNVAAAKRDTNKLLMEVMANG